jgi:hypothetical protein
MAKKEQPIQDIFNSKIEAIKNLILGENIQEYNHEFEGLKSEIAERRKELMMSIDTLSTVSI